MVLVMAMATRRGMHPAKVVAGGAFALLIGWMAQADPPQPVLAPARESARRASDPAPERPRALAAPMPRSGALTVSSVTDGDTLTVSDGRVVRLAQVDAP